MASPPLVYVLLRLPSLVEPHWYTDEAGYATTAWMSTHGLTLFQGVWNNKPPLLFWIYDVALWAFGPSELGIHLLSMLAGLLALAALMLIVRPRFSGRRAVVPLLLAAVLLAVPLFNGDLALPENFLIAPEAWGMALLLKAMERDDGRWLLGAGVLLGSAVLIQQTALAALAAAVLVLLVRGNLARAVSITAVAAVAVLGGVAPYLFWAGPHNVYYYLVGSFREYTSSSLPLTAVAIVPRAAAALLLAVGAFWRRHDEPLRLLAAAWLGLELITYVLPNRDYPHFLLPAVVPACLLLAVSWPRRQGLPTWAGRLRRSAAGWRARALPAGIAVCLAIWVGMIAAAPTNFFSVRLTAEYIPMTIGREVGLVSPASFMRMFGAGVVGEERAVQWIVDHHLQGATAVVWSANAWPYLTAGLRPEVPTPAIYMDQLWLGQAQLLQRIRTLAPRLILVSGFPVPSQLKGLLSSRYQRVEQGPGGTSLWELRKASLSA